MAEIKEAILEGKFQYSDEHKSYAQEEFTLTLESGNGNLTYDIEVMARLNTGELLKTNINVVYSSHFYPLKAHVKRRIGDQQSQEFYELDQKNNLLLYRYEDALGEKKSERGWASKHFLVFPCFTLSTSFLLTKKLDPKSPTPIFLIRSPNDITYQGPLEDGVLFAELRSSEETQRNKNILTSQVYVYDQQPDTKVVVEPIIYTVTKSYFIPTEMRSPDGFKVDCTQLKRMGSLSEKNS
jgi:hypothetical protein